MLSTIPRTAALISGQTTGENEKWKRFKEPARAVRCISGLFNAVELTLVPLPVVHVFCWTRGENPLSQMGVDSPLFFPLWKRLRGGDYSDYSEFSDYSDFF